MTSVIEQHEGFGQAHLEDTLVEKCQAQVESEIVDQFYTQNEKSYTLGGRFSYTEPLGKNFFVEGAYRYSYKNTDSDTKSLYYRKYMP